MKPPLALSGVTITHPDKVLYPEQGLSKRRIAEYYRDVADVLLPHSLRRPMTFVRCPAGRLRSCFYQRHVGSGLPTSIHQVEIEGFDEPYLYLRDVTGLMAMVQLGMLELHPWGARIDRPDRPDRVIFDLDPGEDLVFSDVVEAAIALRRMLETIGLESFVKTTGGKRLHLVVPIERRYAWAEVKAFAKRVASVMSERAPTRYLTRMSKTERRGRIFIDYLRNDPTSTAVAPYSTRARPGAPVATPLHWHEVTPALDPAVFTVTTLAARLAALRADPWHGIGQVRQRLPLGAALSAWASGQSS